MRFFPYLLFGLTLTLPVTAIADRASELRHMLDAIEADFADTASYTGIKKASSTVMQAMASVPRHEFVPRESQHQAYFNRAMSIGHGQTISQPFIVALMTQVLNVTPQDRVLEIGTGSGYQAAVLATLVERVYTIEIVPELAKSAARKLSRLGYDNVEVRAGNGWHGWPEAAPFDAIIVTAAGPDVPPKLVEQLQPGGRMVLPLGEPHQGQMLTLVTTDTQGDIQQENVLPVIFVPLTGTKDD